jgi:PKHD-type hydroxylase
VVVNIENLLTPEQVGVFRNILTEAHWEDGAATAGTQSAKAKNNLQLPTESDEARRIGSAIYTALSSNATFLSAAVPARVFPPLFNCYQGGRYFDFHVDNAIRYLHDSSMRVRTDLAMTLFLSEPEEYEGGELIIEDTFGTHSVKLLAGSMILYPASSLHRVAPVTHGRRLASFTWIQSMVRSSEHRRVLFELDQTIQALRARLDECDEALRLTNIYHNLLRQWAEPA